MSFAEPTTGEVAELGAEFDWEVSASRSGSPTLLLAGRRVHSAYDPKREAQTLALRSIEQSIAHGSDAIVQIGAGLGYLTRALEDRALEQGWKGELICWDPFPGVRRAIADAIPGLPIHTRRAHRVEHLHQLEAALEGCASLRAELLLHPGHESIARFEARCAAWVLRQRQPQASGSGDPVVTRRTLEAARRIQSLPSLASLGVSLRNEAVIVAAAGPSLEQTLPALASRKRGVVLAAVQALPALRRHQIRVDYAVLTDPIDIFREYAIEAEPESPGFDWLLADTACDPDVLDRFASRTALFHLRSRGLDDHVWRELGRHPIDSPVATIAEVMVLLAHEMGAHDITLAGVTLATEDWRYGDRFRALATGQAVAATHSHYFHAARFLSAWSRKLARTGCTLSRVGDGLAIDGVRHETPAGLAARLSTGSQRPPMIAQNY